MQVADTGLLYSGITAVLRHTAAVSLDPANKQRDDDCRLATNIKKFTKRKKRQKKPRGWLVTYIILSGMAFFYSKRLITAIQLLLSRN